MRFLRASRRLAGLANRELESAFDDAIARVEEARVIGMITRFGQPADAELEKLVSELRAQRPLALEGGAVEREWFQRTIRWVVDWAPDDDLTLIAALGRIARAPVGLT
jgi:hypothetical protein